MDRRTAVACIVLALASVAPLSETARAQTDLDCRDFRFQEDAQTVFDTDRSDPHRLDEDQGPDDGIACEALPRRGAAATPAPVRPSAVPTRGARGGVGGTAGPGPLEIGVGAALAAGAAVGIGYTALRRRRA
ncbi:excalibur calcium-binding protein [Streptomyces sp. DH12]|uniref:excalibur calcium-binding protein n=1 Tax=Streptomyces sp. DH12 TaxID=2857010 RepID=UPI001E35A047|nr:excalibur calcium-binding protein [Streptomyces sp. DH12]